ncbi:MAG: hypothetical protein WDO68_18860 [Gammaproteobacteria bacterium]
MNRHAFPVVVALTITLSSLALAADKASPRASYRSLEQLPDFSGWWYLELPPEATPAFYMAKAPFKPEVIKKFMAIEAAQRPGARDEQGNTLKALQCLPVRFIGFNGGFAEDIEFLLTPGRVTLLNESGLVRRIFTDGSSADEMAQTNNGLAVGHWEGRTLIVETHALNPNGRLGGNWPGVPTIGRNVRVSERISLRNADTLEITARLDAPDVLLEPFATTYVYIRDKTHRFHEQTDCVDDDRSIDPVSGDQRFDMTPPANMAPPPRP